MGVVFSLLIVQSAAWAGPPFFTDDPEPADYKHGEFYLASQYIHARDGKSATLPHIEFNYGLLPNMHLHLIAPLQYVKPEGGDSQYGYGDTEFGIKFRFIQESDYIPMVGTFPLVLLPTGDSDKGLGNGQAQYFLTPLASRRVGAPGPLMGEEGIGSIRERAIRTGGLPVGCYSGRLPNSSPWGPKSSTGPSAGKAGKKVPDFNWGPSSILPIIIIS